MGLWNNEPASIAYQRRNGGDKVLEPAGLRRRPGEEEFIAVCGMGAKTLWIRWQGRTVEDARETFRTWLAQPWATLTTDLTGVGVPHGLDFKPGRIDWFTIAG